MADLSVHFSSAKHDWRTPPDVFADLDAEFNFTVDAAADATNCLLSRYYGADGEREDALAAPWEVDEIYYCNPPYGRMQRAFVQMGNDLMFRGGASAFLLPARTDTRLFHDLCWNRLLNKPYNGVSVRFLRGRLTFQGAMGPAPFPSMVVVFDGR